MSFVNITNVVIESPVTPFTSKFKLNITFECMKDLQGSLQWKLIYIGSATSQTFDQVLDEFEMGPLSSGVMQFSIEANPPDPTKIPHDELLRVTAMILTVNYKGRQFFRVGYYIYNQYGAGQQQNMESNTNIDISKITRFILADKPRITRTDIQWEDKQTSSTTTCEGDIDELSKGTHSAQKASTEQPQQKLPLLQ